MTTANNSSPILLFSNPFDDATEFKFDQDIILNFSEVVSAGSGDIIISNGSDTRTIAVDDASQVTFDLNAVTINPTTGLIADTTYNIQMANGVIVNTAGELYAGINDATTLNFTTIADSAPLLISTSPSSFNGDFEFQVDRNIVLFFDENVVAGDGNIIISNGSDTRAIAIDDTSQVTFNLGSVTINPTTDLIVDTNYSVQIPSGAIVDAAGNAYAGLDEDSALKFKTTIAADPQLFSSEPLDGETEFQIDRNIQLSFDEGVVAGSGDIIISNGEDTRTIAIDDTSQVTFVGRGINGEISSGKVTINPTEDLLGDTAYSVQIADGVIVDTTGNSYGGTSDITFATITTDPLLDFSNIENNATFKIDNNIELFFDRTVTTGSGDIIISNGSDTRTIAVDDASQVTFDLGTVIIDPTTDLVANTTYNVEIASGVIMDTAGHDFAGISNTTFNTIDSNPLLIDSNPINNSTFIIDDDIRLYFDETVAAGSGDIIISNGEDTRIIAIDDASQVAFDEYGTVIISPTKELATNTTYSFQMASGVVEDTAGNTFAGISNAAFTTIDSDPLLEFSNPENRSILKVDDNIELFFNQMVAAGSGNIIISDGSDTRTISINDTSQIGFGFGFSDVFPVDNFSSFGPDFPDFGIGSGIVTIDPLTDLAVETTYSVQITSGVITDEAGHTYAGLHDFTFTTIVPNPLLIDSNPINNSTFIIDDDIRLYFDETVTAGSGDIVISNGSDTRTIAIDDASQVTFNDDRFITTAISDTSQTLSNSGSVTINLAEELIANTTYSFEMASGVIEDTAGNTFAGISNAAFTTVDSDPILTSSNPENNSTIKTDGDIELFFDEEVVAGSGDIIISSGSDTRIIAIDDTSQVTFSKFSGVNINPTDDLIPDTSYSVQIDSGAITDTAGHIYAGFNDATITATNSDPLLIFSNLLNNSTFKFDDNIELFFDETVVAGNGDIVISNGEDTHTIAIDDASQVAFDEYGTVIISPTEELVANTTYSFQMASGVVTDTAGHAYAEISDAAFTTIESFDTEFPFPVFL